MNIIIRLLSAFAVSASAFTTVSSMVLAEGVPTTPQQRTEQRICSFDPVADLLPTPPNQPPNQPTNSPLSYLAQQGFIQNPNGDWVCYVNDPKKESRSYTLFKVQQIDGKVVASSFLENGSLINGQDNRSLDLFMMLIKNHTNATLGNRQSIRRYLSAFMSLVKQGKISASPRGYLFDSPSRGFVSYYPLRGGQIQGTAITIDINMLRKITLK
ncbi:hypothetical protein [Brasilonema octagenarum]|uniref:DUF3298 domain-containing protein n=1 Tax=Brasilonema octagenarum UFV-OR1 TaxID=417115 RepID=A0ABX1M9K3_9CYAN|nr:hypothetical protein [Brasilonema octagenarum]NMF65208.1 hypothetical protein [Brasilonema octagenarum UFV-OR1]